MARKALDKPQIPVPATPLVGRQDELARLTALLQRPDVLALLAEGKSNPAIADGLSISQRTVTTHLSRLYAMLDVSARSEAIAVATRRGLVPPRAERPEADSTA